MRHIKVLGITGAVGAGKSTVLAYLKEAYGAKILQLDQAAHFLMEPGQACFAPILARFGTDLLKDGRIDRARLYEKAFGADGNLSELNAIVHPQVKAYVRAWIREMQCRGDAPFLVLEAALLLEDHYEEICDEIWLVRVEETARAQRLLSSRGYPPEKVRRILQNQRSEEEFRAGCQFVIDNSSDILENTYEQIDRGLKEHEFV